MKILLTGGTGFIGSHFINLNFNRHDKAHLYRSAIEGIAFSFAYGIELMNEDQSLIEVIRAGNDNLFQSKVFAETLSSIIGRSCFFATRRNSSRSTGFPA